MSQVDLSGITKTFGAVEVIRGLDLQVADGSFCALLGPSGCGKSTLLRMIAGLETVTAGHIRIGDREVTQVEPAKRGVAMVFQNYALYPHLTVAQNICFSLSLAGVSRAQQKEHGDKVAKVLQLEALMDRRPAELSGGQRQRVAIGRALVRDPEVFLFDEPLSNLDALLRVQMRLELAKLHNDLKTTMIYVTHDQVEAMTLADKIVVLDKGKISQMGSPLDLYNAPANRFVASFIGSPAMNFLPAKLRWSAGTLQASFPNGASLAIPAPATPAFDGERAGEVGVRPEHMGLSDTGPIRGVALVVERLGNTSYIYLDSPVGPLICEADQAVGIQPGTSVGVTIDPAHCHIFGTDGAAWPVRA
ncbi:MAG: sn-glycerol-3-phosphate ABC transporter ATP-binding protein UgpC [bacterium]